MKSALPKVLHSVGGRAMVSRAVDTAWALTNTPPLVVIGSGGDQVQTALGDRAQYALQTELLGTGHALMQAADRLHDQAEYVLVYYADMPLLTAPTLGRLLAAQQAHVGPVALLTLITADPRGFGRIVRKNGQPNGSIMAIVEEREATPEQKAIRELNVGVYVFRAAWLWDRLAKIKPKQAGEYYLTDLVEIAVSEGASVYGLPVEDPDEVIGVNTRVHLSEAEAALRHRVNCAWMLHGVTLRDPATTYIAESVTIGQDTIIEPNCHLLGQTLIGADCQIGPNTSIADSTIGARCTISSSVIESAVLESDVTMGPYCHLRPGAYLERGVHMGNFGEVKNARLGAETHMGHFSYIGDAQIGAHVNIGAGVITVNFDGVQKHQTTVGDHAFVGSDTMLIAPVTIEARGRTAAGAVVTHDVPADQIAVGVPARLRPVTPVKTTVEDQ